MGQRNKLDRSRIEAARSRKNGALDRMSRTPEDARREQYVLEMSAAQSKFGVNTPVAYRSRPDVPLGTVITPPRLRKRQVLVRRPSGVSELYPITLLVPYIQE